jgi:hypothetical protein
VLLKFKFADGYRDKSEATRSLLGKPGDKFPPVIEVAPGSKFKQAKTADGYYQFHLIGALSKMDFKPAGTGKTTRGRTSRKPSVSRPNTKLNQKLKRITPGARPQRDLPGGDDEEPSSDAEEGAADRSPGGATEGQGVRRPSTKVVRPSSPAPEEGAEGEPAEQPEDATEGDDEGKR